MYILNSYAQVMEGFASIQTFFGHILHTPTPTCNTSSTWYFTFARTLGACDARVPSQTRGPAPPPAHSPARPPRPSPRAAPRSPAVRPPTPPSQTTPPPGNPSPTHPQADCHQVCRCSQCSLPRLWIFRGFNTSYVALPNIAYNKHVKPQCSTFPAWTLFPFES